MEFNLSLSTNITDLITYFKGSNDNITSELKEGLFDNILDKSFCDKDESEDIDYNLILNLLNNMDLSSINKIDKSYDLHEIYISKNVANACIEKNNYIVNAEESKTSSNVEVNINKVEQNFGSSKYIEIFNVLEKVKSKLEILNKNIEQAELSKEEIKLLEKLDNIISGSKENDKLFEIKKINNVSVRTEENSPDLEINKNSLKIKESKTSSNVEINTNKVEQNFRSSKYIEIFNVLEKVKFKPEILNNIKKVQLNNKEIELLKKLDNIILENKENDELLKTKNLNSNDVRVEESKTSSNIESNKNKAEKYLLISEDIDILSVLKEKIQPKSEILGSNIVKIELSNKEVKLLKKLDNIIKGDKLYKNKLVKNEKFSEFENNNAINKLNLIRNNNLQNIDKELDTLESIVNLDDNNLMINSSQLINRSINIINDNPKADVPIIRKDYIEDDIIKTVKYLRSSNNEIITVKISPKELGDITIKLINDKDKSNVVITISKSEAFDLINDNQNEIVKHLKDLNINIKEVSIEMKNNIENNFSSNLSQEFKKNNQGNRHENKKRINLNDEEIDDVEEFSSQENINILI